ncbi:hypothetical protein HVPorG_04753 (plasmid) [Roseomonas mucosa]|nr:hypothetical protein HVPorG_04753 [Roseomonas mucosa]
MGRDESRKHGEPCGHVGVDGAATVDPAADSSLMAAGAPGQLALGPAEGDEPGQEPAARDRRVR